MHNVYSLRNGAAPRALTLLVVAFALLVVPHAWLSLTPLRILLAAALVGGGFLLASSKPDRSVVPPQPRTVPSPHPHGTAPKPQAMSDGLLRIAADQKKTIEELRATVQSLEKQVAGMRLQLGVEVEGEEVSLWAEEFFARILRSELWRSRRTQRPLSLLVIEFTDENALRRQTQVSSGVDSSVWQDYAQTICRAAGRLAVCAPRRDRSRGGEGRTGTVGEAHRERPPAERRPGSLGARRYRDRLFPP